MRKKTLNKLVWLIGHEKMAGGAVNSAGINEFDYYNSIFEELNLEKQFNNTQVIKFIPSLSVTARPKKLKSHFWHDEKYNTLIIECHFNGFDDRITQRSEVYYCEACPVEDQDWAVRLSQLTKEMGGNSLKRHKVMTASQGSRPYRVLNPLDENDFRAILWEPFFGSQTPCPSNKEIGDIILAFTEEFEASLKVA